MSMTHRFVIYGRLPSLNDYIRAERSGWEAANRMKREYETIVIAAARRAHVSRIKRPVYIRYTFYEKNRKRDKDNVAGIAHKIIQDALVKARNLQNDSWDFVTGFSDEFRIDNKLPRIVVELIEET